METMRSGGGARQQGHVAADIQHRSSDSEPFGLREEGQKNDTAVQRPGERKAQGLRVARVGTERMNGRLGYR